MRYLFLVSHCTTRTSDRQVRAGRQVHELLGLFTKSELGDTNSIVVQEMRRSTKGSLKLLCLPALSLCTVSHIVMVTYCHSMV